MQKTYALVFWDCCAWIYGEILSNESCFSYLAALKWQKGYACKHCECKKYDKGRSSSARRCSHCGYDESATVGTLFHKLKFEIKKAFWIVYQVISQKQRVSAMQFSWNCEKIRLGHSNGRYKKWFNGSDEGEKGHFVEGKTLVVLALEIRGDQLGRAICLWMKVMPIWHRKNPIRNRIFNECTSTFRIWNLGCVELIDGVASSIYRHIWTNFIIVLIGEVFLKAFVENLRFANVKS